MDEKDKSRVTVNIMGEEYILKGTSSPEAMHEVGRFVDRLMRTLAEQNLRMSKHKLAVLAALNLADELIKLKQSMKGYDTAKKESLGEDELV